MSQTAWRHSEATRRAVHCASGALAFLLVYLTPLQAAVLAAAAVVFNRALLPRLGGGRLYRRDELRSPWRSGVLLYPIAVLALVVMFRDTLDVAAAGWVIMAAGDAAAGFLGARLGRRRLAWNHAKTYVGSAAFVLAAWAASWGVLCWMGRPPISAAALALATSLFAAFVESLPWRLDDNLTVPILSALFLRGLVEIDTALLAERLPPLLAALATGAVINLALGALFYAFGTVDRSGAAAGFAIGTLTWAGAGPAGFAVLIAFFIIGSAATRLGFRRKERAGIAQEKRGARSARHALANCGVATYLSLLIAAAVDPGWAVLAFVCAYATATFDTVSSEVGQAFGGRPVMITTLRRVPAGTEGAISWIGTAAGAAAALLVGAVAVGGGLLAFDRLGVVLVASFIGSTADSILGATLEARGLMDNEAVNFSNTLIGALGGMALAGMAG